MIESSFEREFTAIAKEYEKSGGNVSDFLRKDIVSIIVSGNKVIGRNTVEGVHVRAKELDNGVEIWLDIEDDVVIENPIHLCTGYLKPEGTQEVLIHNRLGSRARAKFISHCVFPSGVNFTHSMVADTDVGENAEMFYEDTHMHSKDGGVTVRATYNTVVREGGRFQNMFCLTKTRVGKLFVRMNVNLEKNSTAHIESKVYEREDDYLEIDEELHLNGEGSSGIAKTTVFATDRSKAKIINKAYGNAPYSRGHIECNEIIKGDSVEVGTMPELYVKNEKAELTHEASIGRVNVKQMETLMSKGLSEEEATDMIVKGMLR
ncbi:SufB/SufD family protein [Mesotoga sp. UBA5557]|jgi:hypothetical protein|uniref:SufB/SufD family protein n=1 Tax=Mesotoga sp. UBA5557 TaxID=1946857 RepID=UPI0025F7C34D|nr:SufD family Fe-S cluster assembly protein [Mesotoga sp. UBA5557]